MKFTISQYVEDVLDYMVDSDGVYVADKVDIQITDRFYVRGHTDGDIKYTIEVPSRKNSLTLGVKKTLKHECGHIIFDELIHNNLDLLNSIMMRLDDRPFFSWMLKFWYWNPFLRSIRIAFGFSGKLSYSKDDLYELHPAFTREDVEFFCDWFALKIGSWKSLSSANF